MKARFAFLLFLGLLMAGPSTAQTDELSNPSKDEWDFLPEYIPGVSVYETAPSPPTAPSTPAPTPPTTSSAPTPAPPSGHGSGPMVPWSEHPSYAHLHPGMPGTDEDSEPETFPFSDTTVGREPLPSETDEGWENLIPVDPIGIDPINIDPINVKPVTIDPIFADPSGSPNSSSQNPSGGTYPWWSLGSFDPQPKPTPEPPKPDGPVAPPNPPAPANPEPSPTDPPGVGGTAISPTPAPPDTGNWTFLPEYQPGESVYEGVNESGMDPEVVTPNGPWNFLPEYQPGESVYEGVNETAPGPEEGAPSGGWNFLPEYQPGESVYEGVSGGDTIEGELRQSYPVIQPETMEIPFDFRKHPVAESVWEDSPKKLQFDGLLGRWAGGGRGNGFDLSQDFSQVGGVAGSHAASGGGGGSYDD